MCSTAGSCSSLPGALMLLALAVGYVVLTIANKQERPLDILGRLIGGLILLGSLAGMVCMATKAFCGRSASCGVMKAGCPMSSHAGQPITEEKPAP